MAAIDDLNQAVTDLTTVVNDLITKVNAQSQDAAIELAAEQVQKLVAEGQHTLNPPPPPVQLPTDGTVPPATPPVP